MILCKCWQKGILDTPRAGGWDLKRFVKTNRDPDGIRRYAGFTPLGVNSEYMPITKQKVEVPKKPVTKNIK